jgi:hypothetical protein
MRERPAAIPSFRVVCEDAGDLRGPQLIQPDGADMTLPAQFPQSLVAVCVHRGFVGCDPRQVSLLDKVRDRPLRGR